LVTSDSPVTPGVFEARIKRMAAEKYLIHAKALSPTPSAAMGESVHPRQSTYLDGFYGDVVLNSKTVARALLVLASALLVLASALLVVASAR
jgi:hypothetical protein